MKHPTIALLTDSGVDVPPEYVERFGIFVIPLIVRYPDREYYDRVDITPQEVYDQMPENIPTTSLPPLGIIQDTFREMIKQGYEKVIAISISSGLSGTFNAVQMTAAEFPQLDIVAIDTKNIGIGAGFTAILAGLLLEQNLPFEQITSRLISNIPYAKVFFCVETLSYLKQGGRIGLVTAVIGSAFNIKPIISCNKDGIYHNVARTRGRWNSLQKALDLAVKFVQGSKRYNIAVVHGDAAVEAAQIVTQLKERLPDAELVVEGQISPALVVHTGPGLIGIGVQCLDF